jgi:hypothetical protein
MGSDASYAPAERSRWCSPCNSQRASQTMTSTSVERLLKWYAARCDGEWEHTTRVSIGTIDNPGWSLFVDLSDSYSTLPSFTRVNVERSAVDWYQCWLQGSKFEAACGPQNLEDVVSTFCNWIAEVDGSARV